MHRLKTNIRVSALLKRAQSAGAFAAIIRRGDPDAGTFWVLVRQGDIYSRYVEQMAMSGGHEWFKDGPFAESEMSTRINKAVDRDPDLWIVEVEDSEGRAFLDGSLPKVETDAELAAKALFRDR